MLILHEESFRKLFGKLLPNIYFNNVHLHLHIALQNHYISYLHILSRNCLDYRRERP